MTFPQTGLLDDFNRADETPLAGGWLAPLEDASFGYSDTNLVNNQVVVTETLAGEMYYGSNTFGPDTEVYGTFNVEPENGSSHTLMLGITEPGLATFQMYEAQFNPDTVRILAISNDYFADLGSFEYTRQSGEYGFSRIGTVLTTYQKIAGIWEVLASVNDSAFTGPGYVGFGIAGASTTLDDFGGGTVVSGPPASNFGRSQLLRRRGWV